MTDCLFCSIAKKTLASDLVFEDGEMVAIRDIRPKAKVHLLVIPKRHIVSLADAGGDDAPLLGRLLMRVKMLAESEGIDADGYKVVINVRRHGGQVVDHLHIHLLGGEPVQGLV